MSQVSPYGSIAKRTFGAAVVYLLETEYHILGSPRVLQLIAADIEALVEEFYPPATHSASGDLIWTCTGDEGQKAQPGKPTEAYKAVTVSLPLITTEEIQERVERCGGTQGGRERQKERRKRQMQRLAAAAVEQGGLLTLAELSVMLELSYEATRRYAQELEAETGKPLPLKGYKMDQGCKPSHKGEVIRCFEQGLTPPDIAHVTNHHLKSVERYLQDYERVRMLLKERLQVEAISAIIGRGQSVVREYVSLAYEFHPELCPPTTEDS
ncbi:MAG TPA: DUF1670 domain-containing protein [Anaerolineae bacterium]|nr:DUF1670 domain-containing protein [Anaerolineae bacterium]